MTTMNKRLEALEQVDNTRGYMVFYTSGGQYWQPAVGGYRSCIHGDPDSDVVGPPPGATTFTKTQVDAIGVTYDLILVTWVPYVENHAPLAVEP